MEIYKRYEATKQFFKQAIKESNVHLPYNNNDDDDKV
jgi:hypothetical protein